MRETHNDVAEINYLLADILVQVFSQYFLRRCLVILDQVTKDCNKRSHAIVVGLNHALTIQSAQLNSSWVQDAIAFHQVRVLHWQLFGKVVEQA